MRSCKRHYGLLFAVMISVFLFPSLCTALSPVLAAFSSQPLLRESVILDAGHGGPDGGTVANDGTVESQINLQIAHRLRGILLFLGQDVLLTRSDENDLSSPGSETLKEQKRSDLKNRAAFVNDNCPAILISIHQNSLPGHPEVHGAQVFYNTVSPSERVAASVQEALNMSVNHQNHKQSKAIDSTVYLMKNVICPSILVECGFLSNTEDTRLLSSADHQKYLATAIAAGYLQYQAKEDTT